MPKKKVYFVHVPPKIGKKLKRAKSDLEELGVKVGRGHVAYKNGGGWEQLGHIWLCFQIAKTAIGNYPKIREILINAGFLKNEIIQLELSKYLKKPTSSRKKRANKVLAHRPLIALPADKKRLQNDT
jgi:hypothetical protein